MMKKGMFLKLFFVAMILLMMMPISKGSEPLEIIYFYEEGCDECNAFKPILNEIEAEYGESINVTRYEVWDEWDLYTSNGFTKVPSLVIGDTKLQFTEDTFTKDYVSSVIDSYLEGPKVTIEYFFEAGCDACDAFKPILEQLKSEYGPQLEVFEYDVFTSEGWDLFTSYGFTVNPAVAINGESKIEYPETTYERLSDIIEDYISGGGDGYSNITEWSIPVAFTLGFFSSFSPCLMAVLSFILAYTAGTSKKKSEAMSKSMLFGLGLVIMYTLIAVIMAIVGKQLTNFKFYMSLFGSMITFLLGLNLLNYVVQVVEFPVSTKNYSSKMVKHFVGEKGYLGAVILGIIFSAVKLPCAAPALVVILTQIVDKGDMVFGLTLIASFSLGVMLPFFFIGLVSGGTTDVAKKVRWSKYFRAFIWGGSGIVVIVVSAWILYTAFELLPAVTDTHFLVTLFAGVLTAMLIIYSVVVWRRRGPKKIMAQ
ncbi:MAG: sulfite exporter TauE/SafE family protein [Candidatus Methanofastidiosa archaeon]|nr:sulfite exporter TauE/SafE family protein [Candidatus Methanofastidiosa archaeon]